MLKQTFRTLAIAFGIVALGGFAFVWSGVYNIGASHPHWPITYKMMMLVRNRSIANHAAGIQRPADLADPMKAIMGTEHFAAHCSTCHGAPGVPRSELAEGMYPQPPDLTNVASRYTPEELFWILKNGIKMTGMPSWADHGDDELWNTVAFLEQLPTMSEADYGRMVMQSMQMGGRHNMANMKKPSADVPKEKDK